MPHVYTFHDRSLVVLWLFLMSLASELSIKMHGCWPLAASFLWSQWDLKTSRSWQSWWHTEVCVPLSVLHGTVRVAPSIRTENDYDINDIPQCVALSTGALYECAYNEVILMLLHACIVIAFITVVCIKTIYSDSSIVVYCVGYVMQLLLYNQYQYHIHVSYTKIMM